MHYPDDRGEQYVPGLIELGGAFGKLLQTTFFVSPTLIRQLAAKHGVRVV